MFQTLCIRRGLGLICSVLLGLPPIFAQRSEEARIQSELSAARTASAERASLSRAALEREFQRIDRNLAAANEWVSAQQSEESRRMNEGVARYLKMVHDNEEEVRRATEERRKKAVPETEAFAKSFAESMRRSRIESERFSAEMEKLEAEMSAKARETERVDFLHAARVGASVGERLGLLKKIASQQEAYWDKLAADTFGPTVKGREVFQLILARTLDQIMRPDGTLSYSEAERSDLLLVLRAADLKRSTAQLMPDHYCALLVASPLAFAARDEKGSPAATTLADFTACLRRVGEFSGNVNATWKERAVSSVVRYVSDENVKARNPSEALEWAHVLRDDFNRADEALRFLDLNSAGIYQRPVNRDTDQWAAFVFETLMDNRDRLVDSADNFFGEVGVSHVTNCLTLQARLAREVEPSRLIYSVPLTSIPRLQAMLRQFRNRNSYSSVWRKRLRDQRTTPERYQKTIADVVASIKENLDKGGVRERDFFFDALLAEARDSTNLEGGTATVAVLEAMEYPPAWRKTLLPEDRADVVTAWVWALGRGDAKKRAALLARYPAILADPAAKPGEPRLDQRLFLAATESTLTGMSLTPALLALAERCDPRSGALPADPSAWIGELESSFRKNDEEVVNLWVAKLQAEKTSTAESAVAWRRTGREVLGRLAAREFVAHETAQRAIAANLALLVPPGTTLAPGLPVRAEYVNARLAWERMIADDAAPLDAARAAIAGMTPGEARVLAFGLAASARAGGGGSPLVLAPDPQFPALILRAVEEKTPVSDELWLRLLAKAEPSAPKSPAEWTRLRDSGTW